MDKHELQEMPLSREALRAMVNIVAPEHEKSMKIETSAEAEKPTVSAKTWKQTKTNTITFQAELMTELTDSCTKRMKNNELNTLDVIGILRFVEFKFLNDLNKMFEIETGETKTPHNSPDYFG